MEYLNSIIGWLSSVLICMVIVAGLVYGCQESRTSYYTAQKNCLDNGGSWVPTTDNYNAACVRTGMNLIPMR